LFSFRVLDAVQGDPLGQFLRRHASQQLADRHAEITGESEVEPALRVPGAEA